MKIPRNGVLCNCYFCDTSLPEFKQALIENMSANLAAEESHLPFHIIQQVRDIISLNESQETTNKSEKLLLKIIMILSQQ